jgi:myo-inositol-1(or 4)-monophosphatase
VRQNDKILEWLRGMILEASEKHLEFAARRQSLSVEHKGQVDLVTEADRQLQIFVVDRLRDAFPDDSIVAEEGDLSTPPSEARAIWYVDPIDGTTNFVHGHLFSCISVARWVDGRPELAAVMAPELDELYLARVGGGATREHPRRHEAAVTIRVSQCDDIARALVATGFPYARGRLARLNLALSARFLARCQGIRRAGSAALDLCWVACGRLDGYWEFSLQSWDVAAGMLIASEAGATIGDFEGEGLPLSGQRVCASTPAIFEDMLQLLAEGHDDPEIDVLAPPLTAPVSRRGPLPGEG